MSVVVNAGYKTFLKEIKERIHKAQYDALKSVNKELINLYKIEKKRDRYIISWAEVGD